jgi:hypothetical protein
VPPSLAEVKLRWGRAAPPPWKQGSTWRRVAAPTGQVICEIIQSQLSDTQEMYNADAIRNAASDVAWLVSEVERLSAAHAHYQPVWEESY